jgi:parvulin-like peptidyl-prolyl isomerase
MVAILRNILIFFVLASVAGPLVHAQIVDGVAAIVNDKVITFSEVKRIVDPTEQQLRSVYSGLQLVEKVTEARLSALKSLIERELIIQKFDKDGFFIPDNIVEDRMKEIINQQYGGDRNALMKTLQANGIPVASFKRELRDQIIVQVMRAKNVSSAVIVSPFKIEQYYQDNIRQFNQPRQVKLRMIYLRKSLFPERRTNAKGESEEFDPQYDIAKEILRKIETGSDFGNLARSYSEGAQRANGGDWGWVTESALRPELAKIAFKLRPGQLSDVIRTDDGFYIMMVEDTKRDSVLPLADVRDQIEITLMQEERTRLQQEWLDALRARAFIKMF